MSDTHHWTRPGAEGQTIFGSTHLPTGPALGHVLLCHGFKGYKDYGFLPVLANRLAAAGVIAHRFNFSHSGVTDQFDRFARVDLFRQDTWSKQVRDLAILAEAVRAGELPGGPGPQVWFGHSRGGITALLTAMRRPDLTPAAIITAASPASSCNISDDARAELRQRGSLPSPSSRTGQMLRVGLTWLEEIEADPANHDPLAAAATLTCPLLILHGDADTTVPLDHLQKLQRAQPKAETAVIPDAGHTFDAPNPMADADVSPVTAAFMGHVVRFATGSLATAE